MRYYLVHVAEASYQKSEPLTYSSEEEFSAGDIVIVPYGKKSVAGLVAAETEAPTFATKHIDKSIGGNSIPKAYIELRNWMADYYPGGGGAINQLFVPSGLSAKPRTTKSATKAEQIDPPKLTEQQQSVINEINKSGSKTFLLHGETGSGKTRVYIERARTCIEKGHSVLVLTPEISLVPQLKQSFEAVFGSDVITMHSGLTKATRNRNWLRILESTEPLIIIGTRSALFIPLNSLGLIIVDEMHEPAYKQESAPRYYGLRVAAQLSKLRGSEIIYGSATPPVVEYYVAEKNNVPILKMPDTAKQSQAVTRTVIDLRDGKLFSKHRYLSDQLLASIEHRLGRREQSLMFLNRRGTARQILCQNCGWQAACPKCDIPLTYHGDDHTVRCHTCGFRNSPPYACPKCKSDDIVYRSLGTKALVDALQGFFPQALIRRFDTDNLAADKLDKHFDSIKAGEVDILVGTQMLGKGLDLPKLSLVGIVNADTSLGVPDFSATERSYQLLHQAIGRVGRGHIGGEVIVQSFNPDNPLLQAALNQSWSKLYESELSERSQFVFPPYCFLMKISVSRRSPESAEKFITSIYNQILSMPLKISVSEPSPSFYEKSHGLYNWQLVIKSKDRGQLTSVIEKLPKGNWSYDLDPINLL